jgi:hypothetical protein
MAKNHEKAINQPLKEKDKNPNGPKERSAATIPQYWYYCAY